MCIRDRHRWLRERGRVHRRSADHFRRRRRRQDSAAPDPAALQLRKRLRASRSRQHVHRSVRRAGSHRALPGLERRHSRVANPLADARGSDRSPDREGGVAFDKEIFHMSIVAGVDFGTLSVRVSIFDSVQGRLGAGAAGYPLLRTQEDPDHATQSHADHMTALATATRRAIDDAGIDGHAIAGLALDTTGSSVIPVDAHLQPIDDYYLWSDHRAWREAAEITAAAHAANLEAIDWCGGIYSSEWGFAK